MIVIIEENCESTLILLKFIFEFTQEQRHYNLSFWNFKHECRLFFAEFIITTSFRASATSFSLLQHYSDLNL
jgi:hypothetical protein